jgi:hypothetical protein
MIVYNTAMNVQDLILLITRQTLHLQLNPRVDVNIREVQSDGVKTVQPTNMEFLSPDGNFFAALISQIFRRCQFNTNLHT